MIIITPENCLNSVTPVVVVVAIVGTKCSRQRQGFCPPVIACIQKSCDIFLANETPYFL